MPTISTSTDIRRQAPPAMVYVRQTWSAAWIPAPYLECLWLEFTANPSIDEAQLRWRYGRGMRQGEHYRQKINRLDIAGWYVKIAIDEANAFETNAIEPWYGRIVDVVDERHGVLIRGGQEIPTGVQTFTCWGLEADLDLDPLTRSWVETADGREVEIGRALPFNVGSGSAWESADKRLRGNSSISVSSKNCSLFANSLENGAEWRAYTIIEYLLACYGPSDQSNQVAIPCQLDPNSPTEHLEETRWLDADGKTVKRVLDELLDRRRAAGWRLRVDETTSPATVYLNTWTFNDTEIILTGGTRIPANANQVALDFDRGLDVVRAEVRMTEASRYDQVLMRGGRIGAVFTVSTTGGRIDADWTTAQKNAFNAGASGAAGYAGWDDYRKQIKNKEARAKYALERVFSWFKLPTDWDGNGENGAGGSPQTALVPYNPDTGQMDWSGGLEWWVPGLRFERALPLREGIDYSGTRIVDGLTTAGDPRADRLATIVAMKMEDDGSGTDRYQLVERLGDRAANVLANATARNWSCNIRVRDDAPGLILSVSGGEQYQIASADFVPLADVDPDVATAGALNWRDNLLATVYVLSDSHLEVAYPDDLDLFLAGDRCRRLTIDVPWARLDYVVPETVVAVQDGSLVRSTSGGILRNDWDKLDRMARLAAEWYCQDRRTITLQYRQLRRTVSVGQIITSIGSGASVQTIRTCVTRVRYDLEQGMTTIQTQHAELDVRPI
jgi:hypothetical protein